MIDWDVVRWLNVALAALVVVLLIAGSMRRWHVMPERMRRIVPWVIATYVVIAYGSGEVASAEEPVDPGLRVTMLVLVLVGLVIALMYRIDDDHYDR